MNNDSLVKDYINENQDSYVTDLGKSMRRNTFLKIGLGAFYTTIAIISFFIM